MFALMESDKDDIAFQFPPFFRAYKDGRVERTFGTDRVAPSMGSEWGVSSKDVVISPETGVTARLFRPGGVRPGGKVPLLVYFHGGAFCFGSPFCAVYHSYVESLVAEANVVALSVNYRLAPEHHLPAAYEDAWAAVKWVASHSNGQGPEPWLNQDVDLERLFLMGDSAGANIAHNTAMKCGVEGLLGAKLIGVCLVHLDVANKEGHVYPSWTFACPKSTGSNDPRINPAKDPSLPRLGCKRVLVCVAEKDSMRERDWFYYETLKNCGWDGVVEISETPGEGHVFHLLMPTCDNALALLKRVASFINQE